HMRIHVIDSVPAPGMRKSPMPDMERLQPIDAAAPTTNTRAETLENVGSDMFAAGGMRDASVVAVLVVTAPPHSFLVATLGSTVEPLVHAPQAIQPARVTGIGVIGHAVLEREGAHARPVACVSSHVGSRHGRYLCDGPLLALQLPLLDRLAGEGFRGRR